MKINTMLLSLLIFPSLSQSAGLEKSPYSEMRYSLFEVTKTKANVVMLGDSITEMGLWSEFFPKVAILNRGISGDTIHFMKGRLHQVLFANPKAVFIMGGINDLAHHQKEDVIINDYKYIVNKMHEKKVDVYIQSTLFVSRQSRLNDNNKISKINDSMKSYCAQSKNCHFIDLNDSLSYDNKLNTNYTLDGIHLNAQGYNLWIQKIKPYIDNYE